MRIAPDGEMAAGRLRFASRFEIAVGQKHRRLGPVCLDPHAIGREHVGAIEKISDAAKALGLALGAIGRARAIEPHELGVGGRIEARLDRERECPSRRPAQQKARGLGLETGRLDRLAVQSGGDEQELVAVERQRRALHERRVGAQRQSRDHARRMDVERHVKLDMVDEIIRDAIIAEANRLSVRRTHGLPFKSFGIGEIGARHRGRISVSLRSALGPSGRGTF